jgi:hypothetical protein
MHLTYGESNLSRKHAMYPKEHHHSPLSNRRGNLDRRYMKGAKERKLKAQFARCEMCAHLSGDCVG